MQSEPVLLRGGKLTENVLGNEITPWAFVAAVVSSHRTNNVLAVVPYDSDHHQGKNQRDYADKQFYPAVAKRHDD
jgi:hypothetical protein